MLYPSVEKCLVFIQRPAQVYVPKVCMSLKVSEYCAHLTESLRIV